MQQPTAQKFSISIKASRRWPKDRAGFCSIADGATIRGYFSLPHVSVLMAAKLKANDGLRYTDLPQLFREGLSTARSLGLVKPRNTKDNTGVKNSRYVLTDLGKEVINEYISFLNSRTTKKLLPIKSLHGKVFRKDFYNIFYLIADNYLCFASSKFAALDKLGLKTLYFQILNRGQ